MHHDSSETRIVHTAQQLIVANEKGLAFSLSPHTDGSPVNDLAHPVRMDVASLEALEALRDAGIGA